MKNFDLTKTRSPRLPPPSCKSGTKEEVGFEQGHMTLTLTTTAQVDLAEVRKQLAARKVDTDVREDVAAQKERLRRLEAHLTSRRAGDCWLIRN